MPNRRNAANSGHPMKKHPCLRFLIRIFLLSLVAIPHMSPPAVHAENQTAPRKILILYSFSISNPWEISVRQTLRDALTAGQIGAPDLYEEHLDIGSGLVPGQKPVLKELLRVKYSHRALDLVIAVSDPASYFLAEYGQDLFPGIYQVISGSGKDIFKKPPRNRKMASVYFEYDILGTLKFALKLLPATRNVVVVTGSDPFGKYLRLTAQEELAGLGPSPQVAYLSDKSIEETIGQVSRLSTDQLICYLGIARDSEGKRFLPSEACQMISHAAKAPVIGITDTFLGHGILGGSLASSEATGRSLAKIALRILAGEKPDDMQAVKVPAFVVFDYRQLKRWGLLDHPLTAGAEIRFRQYSFLDLYWHWVLVVAGLVILQTLVIVLLLMQRTLKREKEREQQKTENVLRESEERYRQMFHADCVMQLLVDPDHGAIVDANLAACEFYGYSHSEIVTKKIFDINTAGRDKVAGLISEVENRKAYSFQAKHHLASNEVRDVEVFSSPLTQRGRTLLHSTIFDITKRKQAEKALLRSENQFRTLVESAPVAIVIHTGERLAYANNKALEVFGAHDKENLLGQQVLEWIDPSYRDLARKRIRMVSQDKVSLPPMEYQFVRLDGTPFDVELMSVPIHYQGENGSLVFFQDITQKKKLEADKQKLEAQLRQAQKMEAIGTLAGGIAHDFNNILGVVIGFSEMAISKSQNQQDYTEELQHVLEAGERARDLVRQILTFSRKVEVHLVPLDLNKELEHTAGLLQRTLPKMISIETNLAPDLMPVLANPNQLEQIILNLAANAQQAMPEGGRLSIDTQNITLTDEYCSRHLEVKPGCYVLLQISDTGQGMDERTKEQIFDPFYTTKGVGEGTGLGLSTVFGIVKAFHGQISCYSELGLGTTFKIYLPVYEDEIVGTIAGPLANQEIQGGSEAILLVDDEDSLRDFGKQILTLAGYTVFTAANGEEALEVYGKNKDLLNLVILDLGMPGIGGYKAMEGILEINPQAKVIIASGYAANGAATKALQGGAAGYLTKPFNSAEFLAKVRKVLDEA